MIFSSSFRIPAIRASGRGGQPGTCTSIGMNFSAPSLIAYSPGYLNGPPEIVQPPIEMAHFGPGIWSHSVLMTGAIFREIVPARIIRSACRGEGRNTPAPNRSRS